MPDDDRYSLTELADLAGVTPRTVRYYLAQGLLPAVGQTGPGSKYDADHLDRLRLIKRLQAEHLPLAEIRHRLEGLDPGRDPRPGRRSPEPDRHRIRRSTTCARCSATAPARSRPARMRRPRPPSQPGGCRSRCTPSAAMPAPDAPAMARRAAAPMPAAPTPATPIERSQWERIVLAPDVELHLRRPLSPQPEQAGRSPRDDRP